MSKLSLELQTDLKNKAINLCCDITKLFDEFNSKKRKTDKSWRNLNVNTQKLIGVMQHELNAQLKLMSEIQLKNEYLTYWRELWFVEKTKIIDKYYNITKVVDLSIPDYFISNSAKKEINATPHKLIEGSQLNNFKNQLEKFWIEKEVFNCDSEYFKDIESKENLSTNHCLLRILFAQLTLSLIFHSNCPFENHLVSIVKTVFKNFTEYGVCDLSPIDGLEYIYDVKDASKLQANGFLLSYLIPNKRYANLFLDGNTYQSCQASLEPITLIILNRLVAEIPKTHYLSLDQILGFDINDTNKFKNWMLNELRKISQNNEVVKKFKAKGFMAFNHIDYIAWNKRKVSIDGFLSALNVGKYATSAISINYLNQLEQRLKIPLEELRIQYVQNKLIKSEKVNQLSFQAIKCTDNFSNTMPKEVKRILRIGSKSNDQKRFKRSLKFNLAKVRNEYDLEFIKGESDPDIASLSVQICLLSWFEMNLTNGIKLSSLQTYKSVFSVELYCYAVEHSINLLDADQSDFEDMYEYILSVKIKNDKNTTLEETNLESYEKKHDTYSAALKQLKAFHKHISSVFNAPNLDDWFSYYKTENTQVCRSGYISKDMFKYIIDKLLPNSKRLFNLKMDCHDVRMVRMICILGYRCGLRISEILGLKLSDLTTLSLEKHENNSNKIEYWLFDEKIEFLKIQIRNNYDRQLKTRNAQRALCLSELLTEEELLEFCHLLKMIVINKKENRICLGANRFIFEKNGAGLIKASSVRQVFKCCLDLIFGDEQYNFSFHTLRHSAANNLAIVLKGSDQLRIAWTDYSDNHVKNIRNYILAESTSLEDRADVWKHLAYMLGHSSIEMTANHYLHVGMILYADACNRQENYIPRKLLQHLLPKHTKAGVGRSKKFIIDINILNYRKILCDYLRNRVGYKNELTPDYKMNGHQSHFLGGDHTLSLDQDVFLEELNTIQNPIVFSSDSELRKFFLEYIELIYSNRYYTQKRGNHKRTSEELLEFLAEYAQHDNYQAMRLIKQAYGKAQDQIRFQDQLTRLSNLFLDHVLIVDAKIKFYIRDEISYANYLEFLVNLKAIVGNDFFRNIYYREHEWEEFSKVMKIRKNKKYEVLVLKNINPKAKYMQILISILFYSLSLKIVNKHLDTVT